MASMPPTYYAYTAAPLLRVVALPASSVLVIPAPGPNGSPFNHELANNVLAQDQFRDPASLAQAQAQQLRNNGKHKLNTQQMPLCLGLGFMIYAIGKSLDPTARVMNNFGQLLKQNQELRTTLHGLNDNFIATDGKVPAEVRVPLAQMRTMLEASDIRPSDMVGYIDRIKSLAGGGRHPGLSDLAQQADRYKTLLKRIVTDTEGLELLATEPRLLRRMGLSEYKAREMARKNPDAFIGQLFQKGLSGVQFDTLKIIFKQLGERQNLIVRLAAFTIPGILYGYYFSRAMKAHTDAAHE